MTNERTISLSREEAEYISELRLRDTCFASLLQSRPGIHLGLGAVVLDASDAEQLRDYFTERLAKVGFDPEYRPNKEGDMLERLIDVFYQP